jgi:hypothetical protein
MRDALVTRIDYVTTLQAALKLADRAAGRR